MSKMPEWNSETTKPVSSRVTGAFLLVVAIWVAAAVIFGLPSKEDPLPAPPKVETPAAEVELDREQRGYEAIAKIVTTSPAEETDAMARLSAGSVISNSADGTRVVVGEKLEKTETFFAKILEETPNTVFLKKASGEIIHLGLGKDFTGNLPQGEVTDVEVKDNILIAAGRYVNPMTKKKGRVEVKETHHLNAGLVIKMGTVTFPDGTSQEDVQMHEDMSPPEASAGKEVDLYFSGSELVFWDFPEKEEKE